METRVKKVFFLPWMGLRFAKSFSNGRWGRSSSLDDGLHLLQDKKTFKLAWPPWKLTCSLHSTNFLFVQLIIIKSQHWKPWSVLSDASPLFLIIKTLANSHIYVFTAKSQSNYMNKQRKKTQSLKFKKNFQTLMPWNSLLRKGIEIQFKTGPDKDMKSI